MPATLDIAFWNTHLTPRGGGDLSEKRIKNRADAAGRLLSALLEEPALAFVGLCEVDESQVEGIRSRARRDRWRWQALANSKGLGFGFDEGRIRVDGTEPCMVTTYGIETVVASRVDLAIMPEGLPLTVFLSHWPSRILGDGEDGDARRQKCGVALRTFVREIIEKNAKVGKAARIVLCGDFNDEPFSKSFETWTTRDPYMAMKDENELVFNPTWKIMSGKLDVRTGPFGTATYRGLITRWRTVDQMLVSRDLLHGDLTLVDIWRGDDMYERHQPKYKKDHFDHVPISLRLELRSES